MNTGIRKSSKKYKLEIIKWIAISILLSMAFAISYLYSNIALIVRMIIVAILIFLAGGIILSTKKGKSIISFIRETHTEIYKVIWPSYQETLHATLIVVIVTAIMSLILWGLDSILVRLISFITT